MTEFQTIKTRRLGMIGKIPVFLELTKLKISFFATLSAFTGFVLAEGSFSRETILSLIAIFLLAGGTCSLNQYQERQIDGLMDRTRNRPLPSGRLNPRSAFWFSSLLIGSGSFLLFWTTNTIGLAMALFAVVWYNGVYTYLKQKTAFAVIPGALIGVVPPLLGWVSGGGHLSSSRIWGLGFFLLIWQVPHFWLILSRFSMDYEKAGLPTLTRLFSPRQIQRIIFIWLLSTAASCLLVPLLHPVNSHLVFLVLLPATLWFIRRAVHFLRSPTTSFAGLNLYAFFLLALLSLDRLVLNSAFLVK